MSSPEIKNRFTGEIIVVAGKYSSIKELVEKEKKNLRNADLLYADLRYADLRNADLSNADLSNADLSNADLRNADLSNAVLSNADLSNADLRNADLSNAVLRYAKNMKLPHFQICPQEGSFIAWKKTQKYIAKIVIPSDAKRTSNIKNRKCRAEFVKTIALFTLDGKPAKEDEVAIGRHDSKTTYAVGQVTKADSFDPDIFNDCSNGIHFFMTREEAEEWNC